MKSAFLVSIAFAGSAIVATACDHADEEDYMEEAMLSHEEWEEKAQELGEKVDADEDEQTSRGDTIAKASSFPVFRSPMSLAVFYPNEAIGLESDITLEIQFWDKDGWNNADDYMVSRSVRTSGPAQNWYSKHTFSNIPGKTLSGGNWDWGLFNVVRPDVYLRFGGCFRGEKSYVKDAARGLCYQILLDGEEDTRTYIQQDHNVSQDLVWPQVHAIDLVPTMGTDCDACS